MKAPDKIYLQICGDCPGEDSCKDCKFKDLEDNVTWCLDRIFERDVEYVRKDYLLKFVNKKLQESTDRLDFHANQAYAEVIDKLNEI